MTTAAIFLSFLQKKNITHFLVVMLLFSLKISAQNDTIFFNSNQKITPKDSAVYYRIKPVKIKTKKAIGHKIQHIDSLYVIKDYYIKTNVRRFKGYTTDEEGNNREGIAKWYNRDGALLFSKNFDKPAPGTFRASSPPIIYLNYNIAEKSLLTLGTEFCLDCRNDKKIFLGLGYGVTNSYNGNYYGLPDLHLSYNNFILFAKAGTTHKNTYILGGLTLMNLIDLGFGYSQPYNKNMTPGVEGFMMSLNLRITENKKAYYQFIGY